MKALDLIIAAGTLVKRGRGAVVSLCGLARSSAEQQIVLALKLAAVTYSGHTGPNEPALLAIGQTVNEAGACPAAGAGSPDISLDSFLKEQTL